LPADPRTPLARDRSDEIEVSVVMQDVDIEGLGRRGHQTGNDA